MVERIKAKMERVKARMIQKENERKAKVNHASTSTVTKVVDMDKYAKHIIDC